MPKNKETLPALRCDGLVRNLWEPGATAPKGPLILGDFGWPWPCMATWCERSQKWAAVSVQRENDDAWFENEYEAPSDLRRWMPWPSLPNHVLGETRENLPDENIRKP